MNIKQVNDSKEVDQRLAALMNNASAVQAVAAAVEGTLGPKGLDTMLVDRFGTVTVTNDGVTILEEMEATHPAARMLINTARAQEREIGDGTTTATVWAGALVGEGLNQVLRGVPVARVLEGMQIGIRQALACFEQRGRSVQRLRRPPGVPGGPDRQPRQPRRSPNWWCRPPGWWAIRKLAEPALPSAGCGLFLAGRRQHRLRGGADEPRPMAQADAGLHGGAAGADRRRCPGPGRAG